MVRTQALQAWNESSILSGGIMNDTWKPNWSLPPEPKGDDEKQVKEFYYSEQFDTYEYEQIKGWSELDEWQRESWRREYRGK